MVFVSTSPDNFDHYVSSKASRTVIETRKDSFGKTIETHKYFVGSRIEGIIIRDVTGYQYFLRKYFKGGAS